jgi:hypothetical protein
VPQIVKYYQEQNMIALKSKGIKKAKKKQWKDEESDYLVYSL